MKTYVLLGKTDDNYADCLTLKSRARVTIKLHDDIDGPNEIKKEFQAPSWQVARIVYEVYNGWIEDADNFLKDLAKYYGYKLEKIDAQVGNSKSSLDKTFHKGKSSKFKS